jgi:hypothetical protein
MPRKTTPKERLDASFRALLREYGRTERKVGKLEDRLGIPRSSAPLSARLDQIQKLIAAKLTMRT